MTFQCHYREGVCIPHTWCIQYLVHILKMLTTCIYEHADGSLLIHLGTIFLSHFVPYALCTWWMQVSRKWVRWGDPTSYSFLLIERNWSFDILISIRRWNTLQTWDVLPHKCCLEDGISGRHFGPNILISTIPSTLDAKAWNPVTRGCKQLGCSDVWDCQKGVYLWYL